MEQYKTDIKNINLQDIKSSDINTIYNIYHEKLLTIIEKHAPYRILSNNELKWKKKPWITEYIQYQINEKNRFYHKFTRTKNQFWFNRYKILRKLTNLLLKNAKKEYYIQYFECNMKNARKIWKGINEIIFNNTNKENSEIYLDENGSIITNKKSTSNKFNKFYTNVAKNLLENLGERNTKYQDHLKNPNENTMYLYEIDPGEVKLVITTLDTTKSGDIYGISPKLSKYAGEELATNLTFLFNKSIYTIWNISRKIKSSESYTNP